MELSKRLQTIASLVTNGYRVADIGTDHGYMPIYLIEQKKIPAAIAMDVNQGPLDRAKKHIAEFNLSEQIQVRLSDGFSNLQAGEVDCAILAGMGGSLMIRILSDYWQVTKSLKECILQPQSEVSKVRAFLLEKGFFLTAEELVQEDGKYYPMMKVTLQPEYADSGIPEQWNQTEIQYGKRLLAMKHPLLKSYLEKEISVKTTILEQLKGQSGVHIEQRKKELLRELELAEEGMKYYAM